MSERKVISRKQLPMTSPVLAGIVFWLALDHWSAPGWAYGAVGFFWLMLFGVWIYDAMTNDSVEIKL